MATRIKGVTARGSRPGHGRWGVHWPVCRPAPTPTPSSALTPLWKRISPRAGSATLVSGGPAWVLTVSVLRHWGEGCAEPGMTPENVASATLELLGKDDRLGEEPGTLAVEGSAPKEGRS